MNEDPLNLEEVCKKQAQRIAELETRETDWEDAMQFQKKRIAELDANRDIGIRVEDALRRELTQVRKTCDEQRELIQRQTEQMGILRRRNEALVAHLAGVLSSQYTLQSREDAREGQEPEPVAHYRRGFFGGALCDATGGTLVQQSDYVTCPECRAKMGGAK